MADIVDSLLKDRAAEKSPTVKVKNPYFPDICINQKKKINSALHKHPRQITHLCFPSGHSCLVAQGCELKKTK